MIRIITCNCHHQYQDQQYGAQKRIANETLKSKVSDQVIVRCTVCGSEQTIRKSKGVQK